MKIPITILLCLTTAVTGFAREVSEQEALSKAMEFLGSKKLRVSEAPSSGPQRTPSAKSFYVFNTEHDKGFVIVSGDDRIPTILGYADSGSLDPEEAPANVKWLLDYYDAAISHLGQTTAAHTATETDLAPIAPLIYTQWGQSDPYNALCPGVNGELCLTGCVATAMAQVINYHRYPDIHTSTIPSYVTETHQILMPELPATSFDWNNMSQTSIARLMLYAGQSVKMDYSPYASGAYSSRVSDALKECFGFSKAASFQSRYSFSDEDWNELLYQELAADRPVLYFGQSPDVGGHAFIIDGYQDGLYHVNWGWDGFCDGYFLIDDLNPDYGTGFVDSQEMVVNACAPATIGDPARPIMIVESIGCHERTLTRESSSSDFPAFNVDFSVIADIASETEVELALGIYNDEGLVKTLWQTAHTSSPDESAKFSETVTLVSDIPGGNYRIVTMSRMSDADEWLTDIGSTMIYIDVTVDDSQARLMPMPMSDEDRYHIEYGEHTIDGITYRLYSEYENPRAEYISYAPDAIADGNLYIPDYVVFQNRRFNVYSWIDISDDEHLTSISSSKISGLWNLPNLRHLELREGTETFDIGGCSQLEELVIPKSCDHLYCINCCDGLRSITFLGGNNTALDSYQGTVYVKSQLPNLTDIYFKGRSMPTVQVYGMADDNAVVIPLENVTIHVASGTRDAVMHSPWREWNIVEDLDPLPYEVQWDYCGTDERAYCGFAIGSGDDNVEVAMRLPADHLEPYAGNTITAIEYYTPQPSTNDWHFEDVEYVFITDNDTDYLTKQAVTTRRGQWMRIELEHPYAIEAKDLFVGIGRKSALGADWANLSIAEDGMWCRIMGPENYFGNNGIWQKGAGIADWNHPLPIRAIITGESLPNDVMVTEITELNTEEPSIRKSNAKEDKGLLEGDVLNFNPTTNSYFKVETCGDGKFRSPSAKAKSTTLKKSDTNPTMEVKLRNRSPKVIKNINLELSVDGISKTPVQTEIPLLPNHAGKVMVPIDQKLSGRNHKLTVNVTEIDGEPDGVTANSDVSAPFTTAASTYFPRRFVLEEATGTWCGYCPRGIATIDVMKQRYPDNFIAIAIHNDEMSVMDGSYRQFEEMIGEFPSARLNRVAWQDLSPFDLDGAKDLGEATVSTSAEYLPGRMIEASTSVRFGFDDQGENFRIAYVLVEDNAGPYPQANYYSDINSPDQPDSYMNWWIHQPGIVMVSFDDVARTIYGYDGIEGLLPERIEEGNVYDFNCTLPIPEYLDGKHNLKVVTLLLDHLTGEILNADETAAAEYDAVDIVSEGLSTSDIYTPTGILIKKQADSLEGLPKGIYIVGNKKVLVE